MRHTTVGWRGGAVRADQYEPSGRRHVGMTQRREIRSYDYVNHPYESVRAALGVDPVGVFGAATKGAQARAESVVSGLHVNIAGLEVGTEITISVGEIDDVSDDPLFSRVTRIPVRWQAAQRPRLFPLMSAELSLYPLTSTETQLDFLGRYDPPLGMLGTSIDAVLLHRIAEASVHSFISDVARYLREKLPAE